MVSRPVRYYVHTRGYYHSTCKVQQREFIVVIFGGILVSKCRHQNKFFPLNFTGAVTAQRMCIISAHAHKTFSLAQMFVRLKLHHHELKRTRGMQLIHY